MITRTEIESLVSQLEAAWNSHSGEAYAAPFANDADFINILGMHASGKDEIAKGHEHIFQTIYKGSSIKYAVNKVRALSDNQALAFVLADLTFFPGGNKTQIQARPLLILEKNGNRLQVVALQNTSISTPPGLQR